MPARNRAPRNTLPRRDGNFRKTRRNFQFLVTRDAIIAGVKLLASIVNVLTHYVLTFRVSRTVNEIRHDAWDDAPWNVCIFQGFVE